MTDIPQHVEWVSRIEMEDLMRAWLKERGWCQEHAEEIAGEWCAKFAEMYNGAFNKGMEVAKREQPSQGQVPDGFKLVPVEPTDEMFAAFAKGRHQPAENFAEAFNNGYRAMLAAAPPPHKEG